jgi:hypothetical protein
MEVEVSNPMAISFKIEQEKINQNSNQHITSDQLPVDDLPL